MLREGSFIGEGATGHGGLESAFFDVVYQSAGKWAIQGWHGMANGARDMLAFCGCMGCISHGCGSIALELLPLPGGRVWPGEDEGGGLDLCVLPSFISREKFCAAMVQNSALSKLYTPKPRASMNVHGPHSLYFIYSSSACTRTSCASYQKCQSSAHTLPIQ